METWGKVRQIYVESPMRNGDVALVTDQKLIQEVAGLADNWDPLIRRNVAMVLREIEVRELVVAIARPDGELLDCDHAMWADLREELLGSEITVHPLEGLPAAA